MSTQNQIPQASTIEIDRCQMYTTAPGTESDRATLLWQFVNANTGMSWNPRITVWSRVPGDEKKPPIVAALNTISANTLLDKIEEACSAEPGTLVGKLTCEGYKYDQETKQRIPGKQVLSRVLVGKDKDGCVWLSVVSSDESRPRIQFKYSLGEYHHYEHKDGTRYTEAEMSIVVAKATVRVLRDAMSKYVSYIDDEARKNRTERMNRNKSGNRPASAPAVNTAGFDDITF